jgi:hypothetical protein
MMMNDDEIEMLCYKIMSGTWQSSTRHFKREEEKCQQKDLCQRDRRQS